MVDAGIDEPADAPNRPPPFARIERDRAHWRPLNFGWLCNPACIPCHIDAGPERTAPMDGSVMAAALGFIDAEAAGRFHITDGWSETEWSWPGRSIAVADHGVGCTAGQGSRCGTQLKPPGELVLD